MAEEEIDTARDVDDDHAQRESGPKTGKKSRTLSLMRLRIRLRESGPKAGKKSRTLSLTRLRTKLRESGPKTGKKSLYFISHAPAHKAKRIRSQNR